MSRSPWLWFVVIGLVPALLLSGNVLGGTVALTALFPAVAALLVLSSGDEPQPQPEYLTRRLLIATGMVVVLLGARLAWTGLDGLFYKLIVAGVPAVIAAWVLSGAYAPSPAVRGWVRSLFAAGAPRRVLLVSALAWPLLAAATALVCAVLPGLSVAPPQAASARLLLVLAVTGVFAAALNALAWYGFVARRLLPHLSPLATGLLIGGVQWLVVWGVTVRPSTLLSSFFLIRLASFAAAAVTGVWAFRGSRGSLLPVWVLGVALALSQAVTFVIVTPGDVARTDTPAGLFAAGQVAVAAVLAGAGRMWRSQTEAA